jgi:thiol-disulfide isomerase/thioredoxin
MTWSRSLVHICLVVSLAWNAWLFTTYRPAIEQVRELTARPSLEVGTLLDDLALKDSAGKVTNVAFRGRDRPTLLYIQSSTCGWCTANRPAIQALATQLNGRARVVGIALELPGAPDPLVPEDQSLPFPVFVGLSSAAARALKIRSTPTTILVNSSGRVERLWEGAFAGSTKADLEALYGLTLPELPETSQLVPAPTPGAK